MSGGVAMLSWVGLGCQKRDEAVGGVAILLGCNLDIGGVAKMGYGQTVVGVSMWSWAWLSCGGVARLGVWLGCQAWLGSRGCGQILGVWLHSTGGGAYHPTV